MRRRTAAVLLGASIVTGVAAGVGASSLTEEVSAAGWPTIAVPAAVAKGVEVKDPVLVANDDGGATLSVTLVNHTDDALRIDRAVGGTEDADDPPFMLVHGTRARVTIGPGEAMRTGGVGDPYRLRFTDRVQIGSTLPITLYFAASDVVESGPTATLFAPVVARDAAHGAVANNGPNTEIAVNDARIVVVPGQEKAYVTGWISSTIDDSTELRPTAVGRAGRPVEYRHQTATGGPSGVGAQAGKRTNLNLPPYLDTEPSGDADYVLASDVEVGETITVTMRFPSGDVVTKFKVVQGRSDGTI
ncbi:hypothetical protein [Aeromicrobium fastidiosum]|nr:hypothetical protein [Aeromicrobium fastidiosum]